MVEGVTRRFGPLLALDQVSLEVEAGEIVGLVGQNGAGKTTLVSVISGLVRPDAGRVQVDGIDALGSSRRARAHIGLAPQDLGLYETATVRENLELFASLRGLWRSGARQAVAKASEELLLGTVLDRRVSVLSGGQRRRAHTAAALLGDPPLLLLDEPTVGADVETRLSLLEAVRRRAAAGAAVLYTTHYLPELSDLEATLAVLHGGRLIARGAQPAMLAGLPDRLVVDFRERVPPALAARGEVEGRRLVVRSHDPGRDLAEIAAAGAPLAAVDVQRATLDDLYLRLAGGARHAA